MATGHALLVGLKEIDRSYYGTDGRNGCTGCERDVDTMTTILAAQGFATIKQLKTREATARTVRDFLEHFADTVREGDLFVFYYSGHGSDRPDYDGDEPDGRDETLVTYDRPIIDDQLAEIWARFRAGVRILMISDSCCSGSNFRMQLRTEKNRAIDLSTAISRASSSRGDGGTIDATLLHFGGCRDQKTSIGHDAGGAFTLALNKIWNEGRYSGDYSQFYKDIRTLLKRQRYAQDIQFNKWGPDADAFAGQRPFLIREGLGGSLPEEDPVTGSGDDASESLEALIDELLESLRKGLRSSLKKMMERKGLG